MSGREPVAPATLDEQVSAVESQQPPEIKPADATPETPDPGPEGRQKTETDQERNWRALRESRDYLERDNRELRQRLAERTAPTKPVAQVPKSTSPDPAQYDLSTQDGTRRFTEALVEHGKTLARSEAEQIVESRLTEFRKNQQEQSRAGEIDRKWNERSTAFASTNPDFAQSVDVVGRSIPPEMGHAIRAHEMGPQIVDYLGKNMSDVYRIAQMDEYSMLITIGALGERLKPVAPSATTPTPTSAAPPPPTTVKSGSAPQDATPEGASSFRDMEDRLRAEQARRRR